MAPRDYRRFGAFPPPSRPRPVEGGIKARSRTGAIGETWWSRRFIDILESFGLGARLQRGRSYARRGQVMDLEVGSGEVAATVQGSRVRPYKVRIAVRTLSPRDWGRAEREMASKAVYAAQLLAGEMPPNVEGAFASCRLSLFPTSGKELSSSCTCPDWASPCKHVAAAFYILAESFDSDPFLVFAWRGRTREQLLDSLRRLRGGGPVAVEHQEPETDPLSMEAGRPLTPVAGDFWAAGSELEGLRTNLRAADVPDALLRQLGPGPASFGLHDIVELLASAYEAMALYAEDLGSREEAVGAWESSERA